MTTALVLPGGGARGAYQAGVLARLGQRISGFSPDVITGVSVGSINAAYLANHRGGFEQASADLAQLWSGLVTERVVVTRPAHLVKNLTRWGLQLTSGGASPLDDARSLFDTTPLRKLLQAELGGSEGEFAGVRDNMLGGRLRALAVTATSYRTGKAITFSESSTDAERGVWARPYREGRMAQLNLNHVLASCALPLLFPAVNVEGEWFGDGSIRQSAPLSPAVHLGAERLLVVSTSKPHPESPRQGSDPYPSTARVAGTVVNALMFDSTTYDAEYATRITKLLRRIPQSTVDEGAAEGDALRPIDVLLLRPSLDLGRLAADYEHHLPGFFRYMMRGWGTLRSNSSDLMATLLFEAAYTSRLLELGAEDVDRQWATIERFLVEG